MKSEAAGHRLTASGFLVKNDSFVSRDAMYIDSLFSGILLFKYIIEENPNCTDMGFCDIC